MDDLNLALMEYAASKLDAIFEKGKDSYKNITHQHQIKMKHAYQEYILKSRIKYSKVKSFFITDRPVALYEYYVPIPIASRRETIEDPNFSNCIEKADRIVVLGTGGSGKSIFMRHLFLSCFDTGDYVPIFVELRDLNLSDLSLEQHIYKMLGFSGLNDVDNCLELAMKAGHLCFMLDGFDELDVSKRDEVGLYLERTTTQYPGCPVIVSSRPDDRFKGWHEFQEFHVTSLSKSLAIALVKKLPFDVDIKNKFMTELEDRLFEEHESFLSNPLLLSIMLLTYGQNADVPSRLSIFYNQAYEALFQRHDANKGGYSRQRLTNLDILDFSRVFSKFSILTYSKRIFRMPKFDCVDYIDKSKSAVSVDFLSKDFLTDLLSATCLLVEDGLDVSYTHRSFQEYFVALFISKAAPEIQEKLMYMYWNPFESESVIPLLYELDPDLVERSLILPLLEKAFATLGVNRKITAKSHLKYLNGAYINLMVDNTSIFLTVNDSQSEPKNINFAISFALNICNAWTHNTESYEKLNKLLHKTNGTPERNIDIKISDISTQSDIYKTFSTSNTNLSIEYLDCAFKLMHKLKAKRDNGMNELLSILEIDTTN